MVPPFQKFFAFTFFIIQTSLTLIKLLETNIYVVSLDFDAIYFDKKKYLSF